MRENRTSGSMRGCRKRATRGAPAPYSTRPPNQPCSFLFDFPPAFSDAIQGGHPFRPEHTEAIQGPAPVRHRQGPFFRSIPQGQI